MSEGHFVDCYSYGMVLMYKAPTVDTRCFKDTSVFEATWY